MDYEKYIFLDYESIKDINLDIIIDEKIKIVIFIDENKNKIPADLIQKTQPFGNSIEWFQINYNGNKNTLNLFITYYLGHYISNQDNKEFIICSKNKDYDPLVEFLRNKNINVKMIVNFKQINDNTNKTFFKNPFKHIKVFWNKLAVIQKICFFVIAMAVIVGVIMLIKFSDASVLSPVYDRPITDENMLDRIVTRINQENVVVTVTPDNIVRVKDDFTARRMRIILISEDLLPTGINPWEVFDRERWTTIDLERNINLQRAQERMIAYHIRTIEGVDDVELWVVWPQKELFHSDQKPPKATVVVFPTLGSDISQNREKIEGIQKILKIGIENLEDENILIVIGQK